MTTTAEQMRTWTGPPLLTFGFRPFFLGAAVWAALAMVLWVPMLSGALALPTAFDPVSWHAHEFLFGYLSAVVAGFLLTAVPNWTGRLPIVLGALGAMILGNAVFHWEAARGEYAAEGYGLRIGLGAGVRGSPGRPRLSPIQTIFAVRGSRGDGVASIQCRRRWV